MTNLIRLTLCACLGLLALVFTGCHAGGSGGNASSMSNASEYRVYIGTFTGARSQGIYLMSMDARTGKLSEPTLAAEGASPSFLALSPNHKFIYTVNEINKFDGKDTGSVSAFAIEEDGKLRLINQQPSAGTGPTHLTIDPTGKAVLVANYAGGSAASLPVNADGSLGAPASVDKRYGRGADEKRQDTAHAHSIYPDPNNRFVLSCDLGLDKVVVYKFDPAAAMIQYESAGTVQPGSGPRHLAFAPGHHAVYVLNEMACTVTAFHYDQQTGGLQSFQTISTLPEGFTGDKSTAEIFVHPSGKFVYASNRGEANTITVFRIDDAGTLSVVDHTSTQGKTPRGFGIDPSGRWLIAANQQTDTVAVYAIDQATGKLTPTGQVVRVPTPVCVTFVPVK